MTVHKQATEYDRTEYDLVDARGDALIRVVHDRFDGELPIGIGTAVYEQGSGNFNLDYFETNWLTLDQARDLLITLQRVVFDAAAEVVTG